MHPSSAIKLVATDLDGTLLDPLGRVTDRAAAAVRAARERGIPVIAVTARPPQATWDLVRTAGLGPVAICSNGAAFVDTDREVVTHVQGLTDALEVLSILRAGLPGGFFASDDLDCFYHETGFFDNPVDWKEKLEEVVSLDSIVDRSCVTLLARAPGMGGPALVQHLEPIVAPRARVTTTGVDWAFVSSRDVSKASAVAYVCGALGVARSGVAAIGDNLNDLDLLQWAGTAMAPENAIAPVLAAAHRVLPGNDADGVAIFLEDLVAGA